MTARNAYPTMAHVLRFLTAGESHGPALTVVVEGLPAGVPVERERIDADLRRRQGGYGRGGRMQIEQDAAEVLSGVRHGRTLGSPVALLIRNRDHENWKDVMSPEPQPDSARERRRLRYPRPGHADLAGALKYGTSDLRNVLERASARETTARVAAGALAKALLRETGVEIRSHVTRIGSAAAGRGPAAVGGARGRRREPGALRRRDGRGRDDRGDRPRQEGRRHGRRRRRGRRARRAGGSRRLRAVGQAARRPDRAGADVDPRREGGRDRGRLRRRRDARRRLPRRDPVGRRRAASAGPRTARAGSKAASRTARRSAPRPW